MGGFSRQTALCKYQGETESTCWWLCPGEQPAAGTQGRGWCPSPSGPGHRLEREALPLLLLCPSPKCPHLASTPTPVNTEYPTEPDRAYCFPETNQLREHLLFILFRGSVKFPLGAVTRGITLLPVFFLHISQPKSRRCRREPQHLLCGSGITPEGLQPTRGGGCPWRAARLRGFVFLCLRLVGINTSEKWAAADACSFGSP